MLVRDRRAALGRFGDPTVDVSSPDTTPILPTFNPGVTGTALPWTSTFTISNEDSAGAKVGGVLATIGNTIKNIFSPAPAAPSSSGSSYVPQSSGIFGIPTTIALVGGGVLAVGLTATAVALKKAKRRRAPAPTQAPAMAGYRRRRRSRR